VHFHRIALCTCVGTKLLGTMGHQARKTENVRPSYRTHVFRKGNICITMFESRYIL
jgi:hypothetical protein